LQRPWNAGGNFFHVLVYLSSASTHRHAVSLRSTRCAFEEKSCWKKEATLSCINAANTSGWVTLPYSTEGYMFMIADDVVNGPQLAEPQLFILMPVF